MNELIRLIQRELRLTAPIDADTPLLSSGVVDSFHLTVLLKALEAYYGRHIDIRDIGADNFDTARQMDQFMKASG